jgi:hypothetical protein
MFRQSWVQALVALYKVVIFKILKMEFSNSIFEAQT